MNLNERCRNWKKSTQDYFLNYKKTMISSDEIGVWALQYFVQLLFVWKQWIRGIVAEWIRMAGIFLYRLIVMAAASSIRRNSLSSSSITRSAQQNFISNHLTDWNGGDDWAHDASTCRATKWPTRPWGSSSRNTTWTTAAPSIPWTRWSTSCRLRRIAAAALTQPGPDSAGWPGANTKSPSARCGAGVLSILIRPASPTGATKQVRLTQ